MTESKESWEYKGALITHTTEERSADATEQKEQKRREEGEKATLVFTWIYTKRDVAWAPTSVLQVTDTEDAVRVKAFIDIEETKHSGWVSQVSFWHGHHSPKCLVEKLERTLLPPTPFQLKPLINQSYLKKPIHPRWREARWREKR